MCDLELRKNNRPVWTNRHLDTLLTNKDAYGIYPTGKEINTLRENINNSNPDRRISDEQECFEIYIKGTHVGDITITNEGPELDIFIFDECSGNGYAKRAIQRFINVEGKKYSSIESTIRRKSPNLDKVKKILEDLDFKYKDECSSGDVEVYLFDRN